MTIDIIKQGKFPVADRYKAECPKCSTVFKFDESDLLVYYSSGRTENFKVILCPTCNEGIRRFEKIKDLTESIRRIKQTVEWFPGLVLGIDRQVGKTTAILEMMDERHGGEAFYFTANHDMCSFALHDYIGPESESFFSKKSRFVYDVDKVRGYKSPIYVDEWWMLNKKQQDQVMQTGRVVCRLGTEKYRNGI